MEIPRYICDERLEARRERKRVVPRLRKLDRLRAQVFRQHEVMEIEERFELRRKALRHQKVPHADRSACDFVFVGRADAAAGGADFCGALRRLARDVDRRVVRENQGARLGDPQSGGDVGAGTLQLVDFIDQRLWESTTPLPM